MKKIVNTENAPKAIGPYNQAIIETKSGLVFTSGQIAIDPKTSDLVGITATEQTEQVMKNLQAILAQAGGSMENVVKVTLYLKDLKDFSAVNEVYARYFKVDPPARATAEVSRLPKDALVEIDMIAYVGSDS